MAGPPRQHGAAVPGQRIAVLDEAGQECPRGTPGDVALHRLDRHGDPDPTFFLGYWEKGAATRDKFVADRISPAGLGKNAAAGTVCDAL